MDISVDFEFCVCGLPLNHKGKCMSVKLEHKEKIGKYSGFSKTYEGFQNVRDRNSAN